MSTDPHSCSRDVSPDEHHRITERLESLDRERDALERLATRLMGLLETVDEEQTRLQQRLVPPSLLERARAAIAPEPEPEARAVHEATPEPVPSAAETVLEIVGRPAPLRDAVPEAIPAERVKRTIKLERVSRRRPKPVLDLTPPANLESVEIPLLARGRNPAVEPVVHTQRLFQVAPPPVTGRVAGPKVPPPPAVSVPRSAGVPAMARHCDTAPLYFR
ncbi:MAG: hypothetical protein AAF721_05210 [Myxococcota bacterium]